MVALVKAVAVTMVAVVSMGEAMAVTIAVVVDQP